MKHLFDFDTAQQQFAGAFAPLEAAASVPLAHATGHVLAAPLTAVLDQPPANQSAMDGYAVRHADLAHGEPLRVAQRCYAGDTPQRSGSHIRRRGEEVRAGDLLVPAGVRLGAMHVGVAAAQGFARIDVRVAPRVGILTTGDELVACGQPRAPQQIYNSNAPMLAALVGGTGADVALSLHAADTAAAIDRALRDLHAQCDLVICVGGASVGDKDLLRPALTELGASFIVTGVRMKPGKPVALAALDARPVVLLPGNPGAAMTAFALFVAPLIRRLQGRDACLPVVPSLPIDTGFEPDAQRERFVRVRCTVGADGAPVLDTLRQQGAGTLQSLVLASGLARLPARRTIARGDAVPYYEFARWLA